MKNLTVLFLMSLLTVGCSSTMTREEVVESEIEINKMKAEAEMQRAELRQENMEVELEELPEWALEPPRADGTGFYAMGHGIDEDILISARKASLQAKFGLASVLKSELSGEDTMSDGASGGQYRFVINNFVDKVNITGYEIVKRKVLPLSGKYNTYLLLKLPYDKFNDVIKGQATGKEYETLQGSYDRLMSRVDKTSETKTE